MLDEYGRHGAEQDCRAGHVSFDLLARVPEYAVKKLRTRTRYDSLVGVVGLLDRVPGRAVRVPYIREVEAILTIELLEAGVHGQ